MKQIVFLLFVLSMSALSFFCKDAGMQPQVDIHFIHLSIPLRATQPWTTVFRSQKEWNNFLNEHYPSTADPISLPKIDFTTDMVIGVFWGGSCRFSGCSFDRSIERVTSNNKIEVDVAPLKIIGPCGLCLEPYDIVKILKSELQVVFIVSKPI